MKNKQLLCKRWQVLHEDITQLTAESLGVNGWCHSINVLQKEEDTQHTLRYAIYNVSKFAFKCIRISELVVRPSFDTSSTSTNKPKATFTLQAEVVQISLPTQTWFVSDQCKHTKSELFFSYQIGTNLERTSPWSCSNMEDSRTSDGGSVERQRRRDRTFSAWRFLSNVLMHAWPF